MKPVDELLPHLLFVGRFECPYIRKALILTLDHSNVLQDLPEDASSYDPYIIRVNITPDYEAHVAICFDDDNEVCHISVLDLTDSEGSSISPVWVDSECEDWLDLMKAMYNL